MTKAQIFYKDIGDYLSREEKLRIVSEGRSMLNPDFKMTLLAPNEHGDWINKRNSKFDEFIPLEPEQKFDNKAQSFFNTHAIGVATNRDAWVYNFSKNELKKNIKKTINAFNNEPGTNDPAKISLTVNLRKDAGNDIKHKFNENSIIKSLYRPFTEQWLYYDRSLVERPGIWSQLLPTEDSGNIIICLSCVGTNNGLSAIICKEIPNLHFAGDTQCFPLYYYEKKGKIQGHLFEEAKDEYIRRDAVSDFILGQAQTRYGHKATKEDIFYYVYGMLHSPNYRKTFANDLKKMLPRLPLVEKPADFWAFSFAGHKLADIHLNYEDQSPPEEVLLKGDTNQLTVNQMKFPAKGQKDAIIYNAHLTISNIPAKAYEYIVNGKSAIEWIMERYAVTTHKESGIKNDPNDWAAECGNPRYILDLLLSVIAVSVKTAEIVDGLPVVEKYT